MFFGVAYTAITVSSTYVGSGIGLQFYFVVAAAIVVLVLGIEHIVLASFLAVLGAVTVIALELLVPHNTGAQPDWAFKMGFIVNTAAAWVLVVATVWYALRRPPGPSGPWRPNISAPKRCSPANILPASIAERLKNPAHSIIADKYDDASILFADITPGYTKRGQRHHSDRTGPLPRRPVHRPGRTRRSTWPGEDQDER